MNNNKNSQPLEELEKEYEGILASKERVLRGNRSAIREIE